MGTVLWSCWTAANDAPHHCEAVLLADLSVGKHMAAQQVGAHCVFVLHTQQCYMHSRSDIQTCPMQLNVTSCLLGVRMNSRLLQKIHYA